MSTRGPAGWPRDLPVGGSEEFEDKVAGWLLDRGPADLRQSPLRTLPLALARVVGYVVQGELDGVRNAYASARVDLGGLLTPDQVAVVQAALESEGARLLHVQREVGLVEEALRAAHQRVNRGLIT